MTTPRTVFAVPVLLLAACGGDAPQEEPEAEEVVVTAAAEAPGPEANADAVWSHLTAEDYRATWSLWPGRGELYTGQEPHGMLLTTYVNSIAAQGLAVGADRLPAGSIIVKENYMPDSTYAAATVMYKVPGFDPDNNDWWWLKRLADGTVEASGQGQGCINCHRGVQGTDYVWTIQLDAAESGQQ